MSCLFLGCTPVGTPLEGSPPSSFDDNSPTAKGYYKKKEENENFYSKSSRKSGKKSRKAQSSKKLLAHNPETFAQFAELDMLPPTQAGEVPGSLNSIKEKLAFYQIKSDEVRNDKEIVEGETAPAIQIVVDPVQIFVQESEVVDSFDHENRDDHENSFDQENRDDHENSNAIENQENYVENQENSVDQLYIVNEEKNGNHKSTENFDGNEKYNDQENDAIKADLSTETDKKSAETKDNNYKSTPRNNKNHLTLNLQEFTLPDISSLSIKNGGTSNGLIVNSDATNNCYDAHLCSEDNNDEATMNGQKTEKCGEENGDSNDNSLTTASVQTQDIHPSIV